MLILFEAPYALIRKSLLSFAMLTCIFLPLSACALQGNATPLKPDDPRLDFSFSVSPHIPALRIHVNLDKDGVITGASVFRAGQSAPFQTLRICGKFPDTVDTNWSDGEVAQLIDHQDFNFDGYEDLELLQNYLPGLDKRTYFIFVWNAGTAQFQFSRELSDLDANLEADPESKTISGRGDWQGGAWQDSTYRWSNGHLQLIAQNGLYGGWATPPSKDVPCGFKYSCNRLIHGKMVETLQKWICSPDAMTALPDCPAAKKTSAQTATPAPDAP